MSDQNCTTYIKSSHMHSAVGVVFCKPHEVEKQSHLNIMYTYLAQRYSDALRNVIFCFVLLNYSCSKFLY